MNNEYTDLELGEIRYIDKETIKIELRKRREGGLSGGIILQLTLDERKLNLKLGGDHLIRDGKVVESTHDRSRLNSILAEAQSICRLTEIVLDGEEDA